ncbi:hypothetical protein BGX27_007462 [Mortierella sp. AM989]|nr:hypothetical protein BGX27_007462 [Mortierella sp. AM989]
MALCHLVQTLSLYWSQSANSKASGNRIRKDLLTEDLLAFLERVKEPLGKLVDTTQAMKDGNGLDKASGSNGGKVLKKSIDATEVDISSGSNKRKAAGSARVVKDEGEVGEPDGPKKRRTSKRAVGDAQAMSTRSTKGKAAELTRVEEDKGEVGEPDGPKKRRTSKRAVGDAQAMKDREELSESSRSNKWKSVESTKAVEDGKPSRPSNSKNSRKSLVRDHLVKRKTLADQLELIEKEEGLQRRAWANGSWYTPPAAARNKIYIKNDPVAPITFNKRIAMIEDKKAAEFASSRFQDTVFDSDGWGIVQGDAGNYIYYDIFIKQYVEELGGRRADHEVKDN